MLLRIFTKIYINFDMKRHSAFFCDKVVNHCETQLAENEEGEDNNEEKSISWSGFDYGDECSRFFDGVQ